MVWKASRGFQVCNMQLAGLLCLAKTMMEQIRKIRNDAQLSRCLGNQTLGMRGAACFYEGAYEAFFALALAILNPHPYDPTRIPRSIGFLETCCVTSLFGLGEMFAGARSAAGLPNGQPDCASVHKSHPNLPILHSISSAPGPTRSIRWMTAGVQQCVCLHALITAHRPRRTPSSVC